MKKKVKKKKGVNSLDKNGDFEIVDEEENGNNTFTEKNNILNSGSLINNDDKYKMPSNIDANEQPP